MTATAETKKATGKAGMRLDQLWTSHLAEESITRAKIQEWIKAGLCAVDGEICRKPSQKLRGGEQLRLNIPVARAEAEAEEGGLSLIYQDEHLIVLDKPPGLTVHPAPTCPEGTLVNRLLHHFPVLAELDGERPGIVHRIDKDTSGLLAVALSEKTRLAMATAFAGIWGMNFKSMPELQWEYGYPMAIGIIVGVCSLLFFRFRRMGWL